MIHSPVTFLRYNTFFISNINNCTCELNGSQEALSADSHSNRLFTVAQVEGLNMSALSGHIKQMNYATWFHEPNRWPAQQAGALTEQTPLTK